MEPKDQMHRKLVLYSYWQSSCSWRVRFALNLKGLSYEYRAVNLVKGEQFTPGELCISWFPSISGDELCCEVTKFWCNVVHMEPGKPHSSYECTETSPYCRLVFVVSRYYTFCIWLAEFERLNPLHYVPVLVDGDVVVSDSYAIILYLEETYPQIPLLPCNPQLRAINLQTASIVSASMQPLHMMSLLKYIEEKFGPEERVAWVHIHIEKGYEALEKLLKDRAGSYSTGDTIYMGDVFLAPQIAVTAERFNVDMSKFPTLDAIYESCKALPEFQASLPETQPDAVP